MGWRDVVSSLLGISAYQPARAATGPDIDDPQVERIRESLGGQLAPIAQTRTRWYLSNVEAALHNADAGDISGAAQLYKAFRRDGVLSGLLSTRTGGLVRLPKTFQGDAEIKAALEARDGPNARSVFDDMCPSAELALVAADGIALGVSCAELVKVDGRDFPVLVRVDPEFLRYRWNENRWYYASVAGQIPIEPGLGRWVLHVPGGRMAPWQHGLWAALGQSWINKQHAIMHRANYSAKLANPARAAISPNGATDNQKAGFLKNLIAWGVNTTFELPPGWDVKIIESKGEGYQVFKDEIATCDNEIMVAIAGQIVTTTGGTGFANADIHKSIRADLIKETADALAYTINTQVIPAFIASRWGAERLKKGGVVVGWDVEPPKDVKLEAESLEKFGAALESIRNGLLPYEVDVDIAALTSRFGVPIAGDSDGDGSPDDAGAELEPASTLDKPPTSEGEGEEEAPTLQ